MIFLSQFRAGWTAYAHREALSTLDFGKRFKIGLKVIAGNYRSIDRTVGKWAKNVIGDATQTVQENGRPVTRDFNGFRRLLFLARGKLASEGVKLNSATRLALFDAAWNETFGKTSIGSRLKVKGMDKPTDAASLRQSFRNHIGRDKWEEVRRACDWISALQEATAYECVNRGEVLHNSTLIAFARKNLPLLWSRSFWEDKGVDTFYRSYFSVMLSMAALMNVRDKLQNKTQITVQDIEMVQGSWRADPNAPKQSISDEQSDRNIFRDLCWATAMHYIKCEDVNLDLASRHALTRRVNEAHRANTVDKSFEAMEKTFEAVFKSVSGFNKEQFLSAVSGGLKHYLEKIAE